MMWFLRPRMRGQQDDISDFGFNFRVAQRGVIL